MNLYQKMNTTREFEDTAMFDLQTKEFIPYDTTCNIPVQSGKEGIQRLSEHRNPEVVYRWNSLSVLQKVEYCFDLVDLRESRKQNNYRFPGKSIQEARKEAATQYRLLADKCARKEVEVIEYKRQQDSSGYYGREYAQQKTAAQRLPRELRSLFYKGDQDVDMVDAIRRMCYDTLDKVDDFPTFKKSVENRDSIRTKIADSHECSIDNAKDLMTKPSFTETKKDYGECYRSWCRKFDVNEVPEWRKWYNEYAKECHEIRSIMLNMQPEFRKRAKIKKKNQLYDGEEISNTEGSAFAFLLHTKEWDVLYDARQWWEDRGCTTNASIHDGCHMRGSVDVNALTNYIRGKHGWKMFEFKVKPLANVPDLPPPIKWLGFDTAEVKMGEWHNMEHIASISLNTTYTHIRSCEVAIKCDKYNCYKTKLQKMKVALLRQECETCGIDSGGQKNTLVQRLNEFHESNGGNCCKDEIYRVIDFESRGNTTIRSPPISVAFPLERKAPLPVYKVYVKSKGEVGFRHCGLNLQANVLLGMTKRRQLKHNEIIAMTLAMRHFQRPVDRSVYTLKEVVTLEDILPDKIGILSNFAGVNAIPVESSSIDKDSDDYGWQPAFTGSTNISALTTGMGKTTKALKYLKPFIDDPDARILWVCPSVALHKQLEHEHKWLCSYKGDEKHSKVLSPEELKPKNKLRITPESLWKLEGARYDVVVIDEFSTVFSTCCISSTCTDHRTQRLNTLTNLLRTPFLIVLDADISDDNIQFIKKNRRVDTGINLYYPVNMKSTWKDYELPNLEWLTVQAMHDIDCGKRIFFATDSKRTCDVVAEVLRSTLLPSDHGRIVTIHRDSENKDLYKIADEMQQSTKVLAVIVSPTIVTGVDISVPVFDTVFCYYTGRSIAPSGGVQQQNRIRTKAIVGDHIRYIAFENGADSQGDTDLRTLKSHTESVQKLLNSGKAWRTKNTTLHSNTSEDWDRFSQDSKYQTKFIPFFEDMALEQFKSNMGHEGHFRELFISICQHRGEKWYTCQQSQWDGETLRDAHKQSKRKCNTELAVAATIGLAATKNQICFAMCIEPRDYEEKWGGTMSNIDDFKLRWQRMHTLLQGNRETGPCDVNTVRNITPWKCFHQLADVLSKILGCEVGCGMNISNIKSDTPVPNNYVKTLLKIRGDLHSLGGKFRTRDKNKTHCLKVYIDLYKRLVDEVLPKVPINDKACGLLRSNKKRKRIGKTLKNIFQYEWDTKQIRIAAQNAIQKGRLNEYDVLERFLPPEKKQRIV